MLKANLLIVQTCWSFNNNDDIEVMADPKGFRFGNLEYLLVEIQSNADNAAIWCRENVNGVLPVPDTEREYNVSHFISWKKKAKPNDEEIL